MEMVKPIVWCYHGLWFKIDLIVWKWTLTASNNSACEGFKIDLIVWKCFTIKFRVHFCFGFKIDLIVWKCFINGTLGNAIRV